MKFADNVFDFLQIPDRNFLKNSKLFTLAVDLKKRNAIQGIEDSIDTLYVDLNDLLQRYIFVCDGVEVQCPCIRVKVPIESKLQLAIFCSDSGIGDDTVGEFIELDMLDDDGVEGRIGLVAVNSRGVVEV